MAYHHNCIIEEIVDELEETKSTNLDDIEKQLSTTIITSPIFETTVIVPVANHPSNKPRVHHHNKIILNLMIKNESNIIERCIGNSIHMVDAVSIHDTGSIDNTLEVCKRYLTASGKPFRISSHPFKTFGHNRTTSFIEAQELCKELEWDATTTYVLALDADMVLTSTANFKILI